MQNYPFPIQTTERARNVLTREELLYLSLSGVSPAKLQAFSEGATAVGQREVTRLQEVLPEKVSSTDIWQRWLKLEKAGFWAITLADSEYPPLLAAFEQAPRVLYGKGDPSVLNTFCIAVIGSRNPSAYGEQVAKLFAGELSLRGATIVSGLAYGIDGIAHRATLEQGGPTIAVLGSGIDVIYPQRHEKLAEAIVQQGCLITEMPPGSLARPNHFRMRNRILSGLCRGVVICEAQRKSGTMITARSASEQGRELFCVPGNINQPRSVGANHLIQQGAILVTDPKDVVEDFYDWPSASQRLQRAIRRENLTAQEIAIYHRLQQEPMRAEELVGKVSVPLPMLWMELTTLEMRGFIRRRLDGVYYAAGPEGK